MATNRNNSSAKINTRSWMKNAGKSVAFSSINVLKSITPNISDTVVSAADSLRDVRGFITNTRNSMKGQNRMLETSSVGRSVKNIFDSAINDIKTGNFSLQKASEEAYDDIDFNSLGLTTTKSESSGIDSSSAIIGKSVAAGSAANIDAMREMTNVIANTQLKSAQLISAKSTDMALFGINKLNSSLLGVNNRLDSINSNLVSMIQFQNENVSVTNQAMLQYFDRSLDILNKLDKSMNMKNERSTGNDFSDMFFGGFDIKRYRQMVKSNFNNSLVGSLFSLGKTMYGMSSMGDGLRLPQMLLEGMIGAMIPGGIKNSIKGLDKNWNRYIKASLNRLGDMGEDPTKNFFMRFLGETFGLKRTKMNSINMGNYKKDTMSWNGVAQKALVEVIPSYLSKIESALTKRDSRFYDYEIGKFKSNKQIKNEYMRDREFYVQTGMNESIDKLMKHLEKKSDIDTQKIETIQKQLNVLINKRISGDIGFKGDYQRDISNILGKTLSKNEFREVIMDLEDNIASTISSLNERHAKIEQDVEGSVYRNLFNSFNKDQKRYNKDADVFGLYSNYGFDTDKITASMVEMIVRSRNSGASESEIQRLIDAENKKRKLQSSAKNAFDKAKKKIPWSQRGKSVSNFIESANNRLFDATMGMYYDNEKASSRADSNSKNRIKSEKPSSSFVSKAVDNFKGFSYKNALNSNQRDLEKDVQDTGHLMDVESKSTQKVTSNIGKFVKGNSNKASSRADNGEIGATTQSGATVEAIKDQTRSLKMMVISLYTSFLKPMVSGVFGKNGLIRNMFENKNVKKVVSTLKTKLFDEKTGIFGPLVSKFKDAADYIKYAFTGKGYTSRSGKNYADKQDDSVLGYLKKGYQFMFSNTMKFLFNDDYKNNEWFKKYFSWMDLDERKKKKQEKEVQKHQTQTTENNKSERQSSTQKLLALPSGKTNVPIVSKEGKIVETKYDSEDTQGIQNAIQRNVSLSTAVVGEKIQSSGNKLVTTLMGDSDGNKTEDNEKGFLKSFRSNLPKMLASGVAGAGFSLATGGHLGLIGSLFLPGGPIGGAIVGMGLQLLSKSKGFQKFMFGEYDEKQKKKIGGVISQKMQNSFKKALPVMVGGAVLGGLKSTIFGGIGGGFSSPLGILLNTMLPGGIIGGALVGMASSLVLNNQKFRNILFGEKDEDGKRKNGIFAKAYNVFGDKQAKANKMLKGGLKGLGIGAITGLTLSKMGLIGSALSMGGPVGMGIVGLGIGIASQTKRFQELLFGTEEIGPDGKPTGKRNRDGLLSQARNLIVVNILDPLKKNLNDKMTNFAIWAKKQIMFPFKLAFGPILDAFTGLKDSIGDFVKEKITVLTDGIGKALKSTIKTIFSPLTKIMGFIGKTLIGAVSTTTKIALSPLTGTLKVLSAIMSPTRAKEEWAFNKKYREAKNEYLTNKWADDEESGKYAGSFGNVRRMIGHLSDRKEMLGNTELKDAARAQYAETLGIHGKNHLGWRNVPLEKKELREREKQEKADQKKWNKIYNLRQKYSTQDAGKEFLWSPRLLKERQDAFAKLGIDSNKIKTEKDIKDLIYRIDDWRDRYATDKSSAIIGETNGNKLLGTKEIKLLETKEMQEARIKTNKYQDNIQDRLSKILDIMQGKGNERAMEINHSRSEKRQDKYLRRLNKRLNKKGLSLDDVGIDESNYVDYIDIPDWQWENYRQSPQYESGDFEGWYRTNKHRWTENWETNETPSEAIISGIPKTGINFDPDRMYKLKNQGAATISGKNLKGLYTRVKRNRDRMGEPYSVDDFISQFVDISEDNSINSTKIKSQTEKFAETFTKILGTEEQTENTNNLVGLVGSLRDYIVSGQSNANIERKLDILNTLESGGNYKATKSNEIDKNAVREVSKAAISSSTVSEDETANKTVSGINGVFNKFFGKSNKEKLNEAKIIRETEESKEAESLGNKVTEAIIKTPTTDFDKNGKPKTKTESLISKITGGIGGVFSNLFGWFSNSSNLTKIGVVGLLASLFHKQIKSVFDWMQPKVNDFMENKLPSILNSISNFSAKYGPMIIGNFVKTATTLMPSIVAGVAQVTSSFATTIFDFVKSKLGFGSAEQKTVTPNEAAILEAQGFNVHENEDGTYVMPGSRTYYDKNGDAQTISNSNTAGRIGRLGFNALKSGKTARIAAEVATGIVTSPLKFIPGAGGMAAKAATKSAGLFAESTSNLARRGINSVSANGIASTTKNLVSGVGNVGKNLSTAYKLARESGSGRVGAILKTKSILKDTGTGLFENTNIAKVASQATESTVKKTSGNRFFKWLSSFFIKLEEAFGSKKISDLVKEGTKAGSSASSRTIISKFKNIIEKAVKKLTPGQLEKAAAKVTDATVTATARGSSKLIPIIGWVLVGYDAVSGAMEAENLFGVDSDSVDWKMRLISSILKVLLGLAIGPLIDILITICSELAGVDIKREIATALYDLFSSDDAVKKLKAAQTAFEVEVGNYNEANGTNLSTSAYKDLKYQPWYKKVWNNMTGKGNKDFSIYESKNSTSNSSEETTRPKAFGFGTGKKVRNKLSGYGNASPVGMAGFTQDDPRWANYTIGSMPDGSSSTMSMGGCGPTALSNVASALRGEIINPLSVAKMAKSEGYIAEGGSSKDLFESGARQLGLKPKNVNKGTLANALSSGNPVIISGKTTGMGDPYTDAGHIVSASGLDKYGNTLVNDPMYSKPRLYNINQLSAGMTGGWEYNKSNVGFGKIDRKNSKRGIGYGFDFSRPITNDDKVFLDKVFPANKSSITGFSPISGSTTQNPLDAFMSSSPAVSKFNSSLQPKLNNDFFKLSKEQQSNMIKRFEEKAATLILNKNMSVVDFVLKIMYDLNISYSKILVGGVFQTGTLYSTGISAKNLIDYANSNSTESLNVWAIPALYASLPYQMIPQIDSAMKVLKADNPILNEISNNKSKYKTPFGNAISIEEARKLVDQFDVLAALIINNLSDSDRLVYQGGIYFSQNNPKWKGLAYKNSTVGSRGDDLTSLAMGLSSMNGTKALISPDILLNNWLKNNPNWYDTSKGIIWSKIFDKKTGIQNYSRSYGADGKPLKITAYDKPSAGDIKKIMSNLKNRIPVMLTGYQYTDSPFGESNYNAFDVTTAKTPLHTVLATYASDNSIAISDPSKSAEKSNIYNVSKFTELLGKNAKINPIVNARAISTQGGQGIPKDASFANYEIPKMTAAEDDGSGGAFSAITTLGENLLKAGYNFIQSIITGKKYQSIYDETLSDNKYVGQGFGKKKKKSIGYGYVNPFSKFLFGIDDSKNNTSTTSVDSGSASAYSANFGSASEFFNAIVNGAKDTKTKYGIMPSLTMSQAALESGFGKSGLTKKANNLFGIKAGSSWSGPTITMNSGEYDSSTGTWSSPPSKFRKYSSLSDSIEDHGKILTYPRYSKVRSSTTYKQADYEVWKAGYATDPNYPSKLDSLTEKYGLASYNGNVGNGPGRKRNSVGFGLGKRWRPGIGDGAPTSFSDILANTTSAASSYASNPLSSLTSMLSDLGTAGTAHSATALGQDYETAKFALLNGTNGYNSANINIPSGTSSIEEWFRTTLGAHVGSKYGMRIHPISHKWKMHYGVDFSGITDAAIKGKPILTPVSGTVVKNVPASVGSGYGNYIIIKDNTGLSHLFAHMQEPSRLQVGTQVKRGDVIGFVGTTGTSTGEHLHYEVRKGNTQETSIDPLNVNYSSIGGYGKGPINSETSKSMNINRNTVNSMRELSDIADSIGGPMDNNDISRKLDIAVNTKGVEDKLDILINVMKIWAERDSKHSFMNTNNISYGDLSGKKKSQQPSTVIVNPKSDNSADYSQNNLREIHKAVASGIRK